MFLFFFYACSQNLPRQAQKQIVLTGSEGSIFPCLAKIMGWCFRVTINQRKKNLRNSKVTHIFE